MFVLGGFAFGLAILFALKSDWPMSMICAMAAVFLFGTAFDDLAYGKGKGRNK
jgi:hypothetical protein